MKENARRAQCTSNGSDHASTTSKHNILYTAATVLTLMILVASSSSGSPREQAQLVAAQDPILVVCSKPFEKSERQNSAKHLHPSTTQLDTRMLTRLGCNKPLDCSTCHAARITPHPPA